jgi:hypothetical protein
MTTFCIAFYESYISTRITIIMIREITKISMVMVTQVKMGARHRASFYPCLHVERIKSDPLSMVINTTNV